MSSSELDTRNIAISMRKSVENLVISSQDAIGQSISQALTFSGVITQNQLPQENRSISRSPSPSPRPTNNTNNDIAVDSLEYDKGCEMAIHVPSHPAGDSVSLCSVGDATLGSAASRADKITSAVRGVDAAGGPRAKKKSWYNSLYPTYKSKSDDFKRLFKDLPDDERLIVDYSCALQKDILAHGRLYASQNYLCFHASIFGWETIMSLRWKDVTAITKEKTALVIPNAILVCTDGEKHFLTSFAGRDKAYLMLFRVWQNALMDQPMSSQEMWQWVHSCYGEELGFNSDDEGYSRDLPSDVPVPPPDTPCELDTGSDYMWNAVAGAKEAIESTGLPCPDLLLKPVDLEEQRSTWWGDDLADTSSMDASGVGESQGEGRASSPPLVTNGVSDYQGADAEAEDTLPTDMSDSSDSEPDKHHNSEEAPKCTSSHSGKLIMRQQFPFNIDQLFTMIFTNSKFFLEFLAVRGTTDYVQAPWQQQAGLKCRQVNYVLKLSTGPIGPKEVHVTETQVMNKCSKPGVLYSIDATSENSGIPYADYFTVEVHYCLQRVQEHVTELNLYGHVKYKKNMWPMVKAFLEKNSISGLEEHARTLEARLSSEAECAAPTARKGRRHRRVTSSSQETAVTAAVKSPAAALLAPRAAPPRARAPARSSTPWLVGTLLLLLLINALLYCRLYYTERHLDMDDLQTRMSSVSDSQMAAWSQQLARHTVRQRGQLLAWRAALDRTVTHLAQTEQALRKLLETIEPSLEKAQREAEQDTMPGHEPIRDEPGDARDTTRDNQRASDEL